MDSQYNEVYEQLYQQMRRPYPSYGPLPYAGGPPFPFNETVARGIDRAAGRLNIALRPDAKVFLLVNFVQVVALPIYLGPRRDLQEQLPEVVEEDINQIVQEADRIHREQGRGDNDREVSSHDVIRAVNRLWEKLGTTIRDTWG